MFLIPDTDLVFDVVSSHAGVESTSRLESVVGHGMVLYMYMRFIRGLGFCVLPVLLIRFFFRFNDCFS